MLLHKTKFTNRSVFTKNTIVHSTLEACSMSIYGNLTCSKVLYAYCVNFVYVGASSKKEILCTYMIFCKSRYKMADFSCGVLGYTDADGNE